jgi:hypothetical protein
MPPLESLHTLNRIARWILLGLDQASARNDADGVWAAFDALDIINRAHSTAVFEAMGYYLAPTIVPQPPAAKETQP